MCSQTQSSRLDLWPSSSSQVSVPLSRSQAGRIARASGVELPEGWEFTEEEGVANRATVVRRALWWRQSEVVSLHGAAKMAGGALRPTRVDSVEEPSRFVTAVPASGKRVLYFYEPCVQRFRTPQASLKRLAGQLTDALEAIPMKHRPAVDAFLTPAVIATWLGRASHARPR